jgi:hypothetical protein
MIQCVGRLFHNRLLLEVASLDATGASLQCLMNPDTFHNASGMPAMVGGLLQRFTTLQPTVICTGIKVSKIEIFYGLILSSILVCNLINRSSEEVWLTNYPNFAFDLLLRTHQNSLGLSLTRPLKECRRSVVNKLSIRPFRMLIACEILRIRTAFADLPA